MKIKKYLALTPLLYKLVVFLITPIAFLFGMAYLSNQEFGVAIEISVYSSLLIMELWMDNFLFQGITHKGQMEILKTAYHGLNILNDGLLVDKIRRFTQLFLLTLLSQYTGLVEKADISIPVVCFFFLEALLQYSIVEIMLLLTRHLSVPIIFCVIAMATFFISVLFQVPAIWIVQENLEYLFLGILLILAIMISIFSHRYMMKRIYAGYYDERRLPYENGNK